MTKKPSTSPSIKSLPIEHFLHFEDFLDGLVTSQPVYVSVHTFQTKKPSNQHAILTVAAVTPTTLRRWRIALYYTDYPALDSYEQSRLRRYNDDVQEHVSDELHLKGYDTVLADLVGITDIDLPVLDLPTTGYAAFLERAVDFQNTLNIIEVEPSDNDAEDADEEERRLPPYIAQQLDDSTVYVTYTWDQDSRLRRAVPGPSGQFDITEPLHTGRELHPPLLGQLVAIPLPQPRTVSQLPPPVVILGLVQTIDKQDDIHYTVYLHRQGQTGLTYTELCLMIGATVVGYHPMFGSVEGELIQLDPVAELAGIQDDAIPASLPFLTENEEDPEEHFTVWVDFQTIWPKETVSQPARVRQKEHSRLKSGKKGTSDPYGTA